MRRVASLFAALVLVGSLAGSSLAAGPAPKSSFAGDFDLVLEDGTVQGHVTSQLFQPTDQRLVPGSYDFKAAEGMWFRETHSQLGVVHFWYDPNHMPAGAAVPGGTVAFAEGVECVYIAPNDAQCHERAVQFVDNTDPTVRDEVMFAFNRDSNGEWIFEYTQFVGKGSFVLKYSGTES